MPQVDLFDDACYIVPIWKKVSEKLKFALNAMSRGAVTNQTVITLIVMKTTTNGTIAVQRRILGFNHE